MSLQRTDAKTAKHRRVALMFELRGNPKCPVQSFEKYLLKLNPDCQYLFQ